MKKILISTALVMTGLISGGALAQGKGSDCDRDGVSKHRMHSFMKGDRPAFKDMMSREFNASEVRTLMEARLLMKGNENVKVGKIKKTPTGFDVAIVTLDNDLVKTMTLAPNAMPLDRYEKIQKHIQKKED